MRFDVEKPKTWKGLSYPLKSSVLKNALEIANVDCNIQLQYWTPQRRDENYNILECEFWPANENVDYDRFYIRAGVVKSEKRKLAETLLINEGIPKLVELIKNKISLTSNSTSKTQTGYFLVIFNNDKIFINP